MFWVCCSEAPQRLMGCDAPAAITYNQLTVTVSRLPKYHTPWCLSSVFFFFAKWLCFSATLQKVCSSDVTVLKYCSIIFFNWMASVACTGFLALTDYRDIKSWFSVSCCHVSLKAGWMGFAICGRGWQGLCPSWVTGHIPAVQQEPMGGAVPAIMDCIKTGWWFWNIRILVAFSLFLKIMKTKSCLTTQWRQQGIL